MTLMRLQQDDPSRVGRYLLTARLGAGGMGIVYLGKAESGRQVAVKVLRPEHADDPETRSRFKREATAIARVRSPHAVQVLDADPDCETPYLVTEFADGPSLEDHVKTYGPLHPEALVRLASALAGALAAIHSADVTHRDLKPANVLLTSTGPKVIDFGIARVANTASITKTGMTIGSPGYMAPEQVSGHSGQKSDIFAWALVVAFAASGRPPFGTGPALAVLHRILDGPPDVSAVPPGLMPLVQKAIAENPEQRPTAAELLRELSADPADLVTPADLAGAGAVVGAGALAAAAGDATADGKLEATGAMAAVGETAEAGPGGGEAGPGTGNAASSGSRRVWRAAAVAVPVVAAMVAAEVMLAQSGVERAVHPSGHVNPRPAVARTPVSRHGNADYSGGPGSVAGSGVPGTPSGGASPSAVPRRASSRAASHPVRSPSSAPASSPAPSPSSTAPSTAPSSSTPPSSPSTTPSSTPPSSPSSSPSPSGTASSSASPSLASPTVSPGGSGSATPSETSS